MAKKKLSKVEKDRVDLLVKASYAILSLLAHVSDSLTPAGVDYLFGRLETEKFLLFAGMTKAVDPLGIRSVKKVRR